MSGRNPYGYFANLNATGRKLPTPPTRPTPQPGNSAQQSGSGQQPPTAQSVSEQKLPPNDARTPRGKTANELGLEYKGDPNAPEGIRLEDFVIPPPANAERNVFKEHSNDESVKTAFDNMKFEIPVTKSATKPAKDDEPIYCDATSVEAAETERQQRSDKGEIYANVDRTTDNPQRNQYMTIDQAQRTKPNEYQPYPSSVPDLPLKPEKFRVPPKPAELRKVTAEEHLRRANGDLEIEHVNSALGQRRELYDARKHGGPSFKGHFIMKDANGGLVFKDVQEGSMDKKDGRLIHVPPEVAKNLMKDKATNELIDKSLMNGRSGEPVRFRHDAGKEQWAISKDAPKKPGRSL